VPDRIAGIWTRGNRASAMAAAPKELIMAAGYTVPQRWDILIGAGD
jgi:hypothetical protein